MQETCSTKVARSLARGAILAVLLASAGSQGVAQEAESHFPPRTGVVETDDGPVRGIIKDGVRQFLGIPYAAPPVGRLRWRPPQRPASRTETLDATEFAGRCAQITTLGVFAGPPTDNEDCLYLNIFTPRVGKGAKLPVLVWIHGGGHFDGESNDYDGSKMARDGNTVVVTINYRLGLFGYFAHPALNAEGHPFGNYGLMDQQQALRWVRANIAAFGGNPRNVTLGGQSAGSGSTILNMVSPYSRGLFDRAILQSGPTLSIIPLEAAAERHQAFGDTIGCPGTGAATARCLRSLSAEEILQYQGTESANSRFVTGPLLDGTLVPVQPDTAFATGRFNRMPVMIGSTRDEITFTESIYEYFFGPATASRYDSLLTLTYELAGAGPGGTPPAYPPGTVQRIMNRYPLSAYASPALALSAIGSHAFACRVRQLNIRLSRWVPVYAYEFVYQNAPYYFPPLSFPVGASHTIDIQFLFPLYHGGQGIVHQLNPQEERLSDRLVDFWTTFARDGNPNGDGRNQPWPRYLPSRPIYLVQDIPHLSTYSGPEYSRIHKCGFWDTVLLY